MSMISELTNFNQFDSFYLILQLLPILITINIKFLYPFNLTARMVLVGPGQKTDGQQEKKKFGVAEHMHNFNRCVAEIVSNKICRELTEHMDYKALKLRLERSRQEKVNLQAIEYLETTADQIRHLDELKPQCNVIDEVINSDTLEKTKQLGFGRRVSILKIRKSGTVQKKNCATSRLSKRFLKAPKQNHRGLVKLATNQEDEQTFTDYIEKLRQKKIKFAEVMELFNQDGKQKQSAKQMKVTTRQMNQIQRPVITSLAGQVLKCEKRQQNSKKDEIYLEKIRIRPLFKLRQHVSSRADIYKKGEMPTEARRVSISNEIREGQNYTPKDDNYYIKSIIDVIANRKQLDQRRRKNHLR